MRGRARAVPADGRTTIDSPLLYPLAFGALVLSKGQSVAKSALVPAVVDRRGRARARQLAPRDHLGASAASVGGAVRGRRSSRSSGAPWVLRAGVARVRLRDRSRVRHPAGASRSGRGETVDERERAARAEHRRRRHRDGSVARRRRLLHVLRRVRAEARARAGVGVRRRAHRERGRQRPRHGASRRSCARRCARNGCSRARCSFPRCRSCSRRATYGRVSLVAAAATVAAVGRVRAGRVRQPAPARRRGSRHAAARSRASRPASSSSWVAGGVLAVALPRRRARRASSSSRSCCCSPACRTSAASPAHGARPEIRRRAPRPAARARTSGCHSRSAPIGAGRARRPARRRPARLRRHEPPHARRSRRAGPTRRARPDAGRVRDGDAWSASSRTYSFELTMPGGALRARPRPCRGSSVLPTHRRRGVLTQMMRRAARRRARTRNEPAAILTASESSIYGRFGYGVATWRLGDLGRAGAHRVRRDTPTTTGRMRIAHPRRGAARCCPRSTTRTRPVRGRAWSRGPTSGGRRCSGTFLAAEATKACFFAVHTERDGRRRRLRRLRDQRRVGRRPARSQADRVVDMQAESPADARSLVAVRASASI